MFLILYKSEDRTINIDYIYAQLGIKKQLLSVSLKNILFKVSFLNLAIG